MVEGQMELKLEIGQRTLPMSFNVILVAPMHDPEERAMFLLFFISVKEHRVHVY